MAIVWPCSLSVDAYAALGKTVEVPRPDCPGCARSMIFWSGYLRPVRVLGRCVRLFVRRARCPTCVVTHALLPAFVLVKRLDAVEVIGGVLESVAGRRHGLRPAAASAGVPHETARGWWRRLRERAEEQTISLAALATELGATCRPGRGAAATVAALEEAFVAASALPGWGELGRWRFWSAASGGGLLATNSTSPYLVVGRRRFMPPVPFPDDTEDRTHGP